MNLTSLESKDSSCSIPIDLQQSSISCGNAYMQTPEDDIPWSCTESTLIFRPYWIPLFLSFIHTSKGLFVTLQLVRSLVMGCCSTLRLPRENEDSGASIQSKRIWLCVGITLLTVKGPYCCYVLDSGLADETACERKGLALSTWLVLLPKCNKCSCWFHNAFPEYSQVQFTNVVLDFFIYW